MQGDISVSSKLGAGTQFTVRLPVSRVAKKQPFLRPQPIRETAPEIIPQKKPEAPKTTQTLPKATANRLLALVIEDNPDVVHYLKACLEADYRLLVAHNGKQGINRALEHIPEIIVCDVMMPEKDGFEVCKTLKTDMLTSHIPIILLTARADTGSRLEGLEQGADAYLAKPFHKPELLIRMRKLLELRKKLQTYYQAVAEPAQGQTGAAPGLPGKNLDSEFVSRARNIVEAHLDDHRFDVEAMCKELAVSHSQLHRKLTALTGLSANRFIRFIRLSKAKTLLNNPSLSIAEVAYDTGFNDPVYFSRVFKKEFGMTPTSFRENS